MFLITFLAIMCVYHYKIIIFLGMAIILVIFLPMIFFIVECISDNGYTIKKVRTPQDNYQLATFNDAIVKELMNLRLDVTSMKISQDKQIIKEFGLEDNLAFPDDFELLYRIYERYPYSAIRTSYKTKNSGYGGIIILLNHSISELDDPSSYDIEILRILHAYKGRMLTENDTVTVHIFDPDIDEKFCMRDRSAKIISINHDDIYSSLVTLEITILSNDDFDAPGYSRDEPDEKITRKIRFYNDHSFKSSKKI